MEINQPSKSLPNCKWCHAAAKRPEFRGANLERRSIQRIERLGVRGTDALGGDARLRGAAAGQNLSPNPMVVT